MVDQLSAFADEVTRVAREVGTEGRLGGQADVQGVSGTWKDLTDNVNFMADNLTAQVRNIAQVTTAVAQGDLSQKITVDARGEILELKTTINTMVDQLSAFADEVTRVAREVGTEGNLGGQAQVRGVVRHLEGPHRQRQRHGAQPDRPGPQHRPGGHRGGQRRPVARRSPSRPRARSPRSRTPSTRWSTRCARSPTRSPASPARSAPRAASAARPRCPSVAGTWKDLTDNVNSMANNLTSQVRNIAQVTTAVAKGDLTQKIDVDARGEILELKTTINTMVDQLSSFAAEVTRVAREVGTEGQLGGQAEVEGVSGTWKRLTENVNELAGNLTTQVRAIAEVATAVDPGRPDPLDRRGRQRRGRRAQGQHQPDGRQPARDHPGQPGAGLAEVQPGPHLRPDAGPPRPAARSPS